MRSLPRTCPRQSIRSRAPSASSAAVRRVMRANVGKESAPEMALRSSLHSRGLRFKKSCRPEPTVRCTADIVFRRKQVCVFVDGCYWHGCPLHFVPPHKNRDWWLEKIQANIDRDCRQTELLEGLGWKVIRIWEHEIKEDLDAAAERVREALL